MEDRRTQLVAAEDLSIGAQLADGDYWMAEEVTSIRVGSKRVCGNLVDGIYVSTDATDALQAADYFVPRARKVHVYAA